MKEGVAALSRGGRRPISRSAFKLLSAHVVGAEERAMEERRRRLPAWRTTPAPPLKKF